MNFFLNKVSKYSKLISLKNCLIYSFVQKKSHHTVSTAQIFILINLFHLVPSSFRGVHRNPKHYYLL